MRAAIDHCYQYALFGMEVYEQHSSVTVEGL